MEYYKDKITGDVWAYDSEQMAVIRRINEPDFDIEKEEISVHYFEINEKIKGMHKMTKKEIDAHINPPLTKGQQIDYSEEKKQTLIAEATDKTELWRTQLALGIITDKDKASLTKWMLYVQKVQAVDTSAAPDIIWPEKPE